MKTICVWRKSLDARGALHYIVPLAVIVLFGVLGVGYLVLSNAAPPLSEVQVFSMGPGGYCLTSNTTTGAGNTAAWISPCNGSPGQRWQMTGQTINNPLTHGCLAMGGLPSSGNPVVSVVDQTCNGSTPQKWVELNGVNTGLMVNGRSTATRKECLVDPNNGRTAATVVAATECHTTPPIPPDQQWFNATYSAASTPTPPKPPTPTPTPTPPPAKSGCLKTTNGSGSSGTCVGALQEMVNGMHVLNDYNVLHKSGYKNSFPGLSASSQYLAIDNSFGPATLTAVKDAQRMAGTSADGIVGAQTWSSLCYYNNPSNHFLTGAVASLHPTYANQGGLGYKTACH